MDPAFMQAVAPKPHTVLGLRLQPLTLGHRFLLAKHNSFFVTGHTYEEDFFGALDLMMASFICSNKSSRTSELMINSGWPFRVFCWLWARRILRMDFLIERKRFDNYWSQWHEVPRVQFERNPGTLINAPKDVGSPFEWTTLAMLYSDFNRTNDEAMEMTFVEAGNLWAAEGERKGDFSLKSNRHMDSFEEFCKQQDLEKKAAGKLSRN